MQTGRAIASALNVAQTAHSYGDFMLLAKAAESKQVAYYFQSPLKYVGLLGLLIIKLVWIWLILFFFFCLYMYM